MTGGTRYAVFPYQEEEEVLNPATGQAHFEVRPTLDVSVHSSSGRSTRVHALVDTGAPITLLGQLAALRLDIDVDTRDESRVQRVDILGKTHEVVMADVRMQLEHFPGLDWTTSIGFLREDLDLPFLGVLGTAGFLDRWVVSFNRSENYFVVEEPASFAGRQPVDPVETVLHYFGDEVWWRTGD